MTHSNPGELISIRGHTLTVAEGHAIAFGSVGFLAGLSDEISVTIRKEPHYALSTFIVAFLLGEAYSRAFADIPLDPEAE